MEIKDLIIQSETNHKYNFNSCIMQITGKPVNEALKLFEIVGYYEEYEHKQYFDENYRFVFKDKDYYLDNDKNHHCLCYHVIHKIILVSYDNQIYKVGSSCINKFDEDLTKKQKEKIKELKQKNKDFYKNIKKTIEEYYTKEKQIREYILNDFDDEYSDIIEEFNEKKKTNRK